MSIVTVTLNPTIDKTFSVERVVPERKLRGGDVTCFPGGGGINVARTATRLGADVQALWSSGGYTGETLARLLDDEGIRHQPIPIRGSVRENLIVREVSCNQHYRFGMPGPELTEDERTRWMAEVRQRSTSARYLVLSGSLPPGVAASWFGELVRAAADGVRVVVDTKQDALREALDVGVYLVKPNVRELAELTGRVLDGDDQVAGAARSLIDRGAAEAVLVSVGRAGALLATADGTIRLAAPTVPISSKVGAGDSMVGGLVTALDAGASLNHAARQAVAAGAAAVMTPGTELCRPEDVARLCERLQDPEPVR